MRKIAALAGAVFGFSVLASPLALAADYPTRPITLIHGFAAGGTADAISRLVAQPMSEILKQPVIVEQRPGAGGNNASRTVATAAPDGYTIGLPTGGHAVSAGLYKSLPFHPVDSFEMISTVVYYAFAIAVKPDFPANDMKALLAYAKANPGKLDYGSAGVGSTHHLTGELLASVAGIQWNHVPYRGEAAAFTGLLSGDLPIIIATAVTVQPQLASGKLKALAVTSPTRFRGMPNVPTVAESALPGFDVRTWAGLFAPKGTPREIIMKLNGAVQQALARPEVKTRIEEIVGGDVQGSTPEAMKTMVASEAARWTDVIKKANIPQQE
ncbi:MAG: tripartite tricarboxylate transporter substrate binding protein [Ferrovibrio sp.]|uniref:Bug family tripartite tricarboxylate transporter substrate binding protein n=1 Tax=Ferrovibrio sp. TaxID=1917215 RepID=UPI00261C3075|nr:tripartite tricarboxylate transporter substrate binding protein [Ferrovibrio sp.]MCW0235141.1 tripartite tricarboxylate transporter substrate binding protein [Ferrovibrio sp.]